MSEPKLIEQSKTPLNPPAIHQRNGLNSIYPQIGSSVKSTSNGNTMTPTQIFDRVSEHLLTQKAKSLGLKVNTGQATSTFCKYRGDQGRSCAVGCLISDEYYSEDLEGGASYTPAVKWAVANSLKIPFREVPDTLLEKLQTIHDHNNPEDWPALLDKFKKELASRYPVCNSSERKRM